LITQCRHFIGTQQNGESSHWLPLLTMDAMLLVTSLHCCCCYGGGVVILISWLEEMLWYALFLASKPVHRNTLYFIECVVWRCGAVFGEVDRSAKSRLIPFRCSLLRPCFLTSFRHFTSNIVNHSWMLGSSFDLQHREVLGHAYKQELDCFAAGEICSKETLPNAATIQICSMRWWNVREDLFFPFLNRQLQIWSS
jgi:hypothetical protein